MKNIEDLVSPLIQSQFPAFYNEEGPLFIEFVKSYYKWLETTGQQAYYARNLIEFRDIDKTVDDFIIHFKETFLKDLPLINQVNERLLVRNILDLYQNKGNEQSVKLLIRALFNQDSSVYLPGEDVLKLSDGTWVKPKYLEVTISPRNINFLNREIQGASSEAKAFCESVVRKRINGKYIEVLFLSNVRGDFAYGEKIVETSNTNITNSPTVVGSLTSLSVLNGGQDFSVGDEFNVVSPNGKNGKAIVSSISSETGRVKFTIEDGGFGYSNTANVFISDKIIRFNNLINSNTQITVFDRFENVSQQIMSVGFTSAVNAQYFSANTILFAQGNSTVSNATAGILSVTLTSNTVGVVKVSNISGNIVATNTTFKASLVDLVYNTSSNISLFTANSVIEAINATSSANAFILSVSTANTTRGSLLLRPISGNVAATNTSFRLATNNATIATVNTYTSNLSFTAVVANNSNLTASGKLIGSNSTHIGLDSVTNSFLPNSIFSYVIGSTSNSYANIDFVSSGSDANFVVGSLDNEETVLLNPDLLAANNTGSIPFMNVNLDLNPNNANAAGYGFVKFPGADVNTTLLNAIRFNSTTIGTISTLTSINPGTDYNIDPFVLVYEPDVAGYKRKDFNIAINRNMVLSLNQNGDRVLSGNNDGNPTHVTVVGKPIGQFFGFVMEGVYSAADVANPAIIKTAQVYEGNPKYKDVNGDGLISDFLDYTMLGSPHPDFIFGFSNNFSYKNFSLGVILNGQYGGQVMNGLRQTTDNLQGFFNVSKVFVNRWRSAANPGDPLLYGVPKLTPSWGHRVNSRWVEDASFLRVSNVTLGYSIPSSFVQKSKLFESCRLYLTCRNLAMFTKYTGANPEAQSRNIDNTLSQGFDMSSYPLATTTSLGLNLSF